MTSTSPSTSSPLTPSWIPRGWGLLFLAAGLWTLLGAIPGLVAPETAYANFHAGPITPDVVLLFRGSSGQTFLFAVGYLTAAFAPRRHALVVALGGAGKATYAVRLLFELAAGHAGPLTSIAIVGDFLFVAAFVAFFVREAPFRRTDERASGPSRA